MPGPAEPPPAEPPPADGPLPVLWLYGPPGVGKSTVGWELFTRLSVPAGYVDIDQLGMCYGPPGPDAWMPEPADDPGRHRMKARNLDSVVVNQRAAGARLVIVSGVVDARRGVDRDLLPHAAVRTLRLRADPPELGRRLAGRGRQGGNVDAELAHAEELDRFHPADECVDTTGRRVGEVLAAVSARLDGWPAASGRGSAPPPVVQPVPGEILWVSGVTGVGKSTVGWHVYRRFNAAGVHTAFVDLEQVGFHRPAPPDDPDNHRLRAADVAALWRTFHARGARRLVMVGTLDDADTVRTYAAALPAARLTVCRLHAGPATLHERIRRRGSGIGAIDLAGDRLRGRTRPQLRAIAARAAADAQALDRAGVGDLRVDTDGRDVDRIVDEIILGAVGP